MPNNTWFDAHLDLAYLHLTGRDMEAAPSVAGGAHLPASVTLPSLLDGGVRYLLGTIYTQADGDGAHAYPTGDAAVARAAGIRQLAWYQSLYDSGRFVKLSDHLHTPPPENTIAVGILMENAEPIRDADDLAWWRERGVIAVGLAWVPASRYAGGNSTTQGLTAAGRDLVQALDALHIVHDTSHLSQAATDELLSLTDRAVVATHSNSRALLGGQTARHLNDETIREIGRRGGIIGLNLCRNFIRAGDKLSGDERPTIAEAIRHVEYISGIIGSRAGVGLGSDLDGGFSACDLPQGINLPRDFAGLDAELAGRGWSESDRAGFRCENWLRFWRQQSPGLGAVT